MKMFNKKIVGIFWSKEIILMPIINLIFIKKTSKKLCLSNTHRQRLNCHYTTRCLSKLKSIFDEVKCILGELTLNCFCDKRRIIIIQIINYRKCNQYKNWLKYCGTSMSKIWNSDVPDIEEKYIYRQLRAENWSSFEIFKK